MIPMLFENRPKCPIYIYFGTRNTSPSATFARPVGCRLASLANVTKDSLIDDFDLVMVGIHNCRMYRCICSTKKPLLPAWYSGHA